MAIQPIRQLGDPILREICRKTNAEQAGPVLGDLRDTLHDFRRRQGFGRGIAAPQIGQAIRAIYIEFEDEAFSILNPVYTFRSAETFAVWDDCFSFPQYLVLLDRHVEIEIRFEDMDGPRTLRARGPLSELLQHEMDHLDGVLALDRSNTVVTSFGDMAVKEPGPEESR